MFIRTLLLSSFFAVACGTAHAAETFLDTWNDGDVSCWLGDTAWTVVAVEPANGNPGGWLRSSATSGPLTHAGIQTEKPEVTGNWILAEAQSLSVDVRLLEGTPTTAGFRLRPSPVFNAWYYAIPANMITGTWTRFALSIDPTWSDAQAIAAGWAKEDPTVPSWQDTLAAHRQLSFRVGTSGDVLEVGYDNFWVVFNGPSCSGDVNLDGVVDVEDLLLLLAVWGEACDCCPQDVHRDQQVDINDLLGLLAQWGTCG